MNTHALPRNVHVHPRLQESHKYIHKHTL